MPTSAEIARPMAMAGPDATRGWIRVWSSTAWAAAPRLLFVRETFKPLRSARPLPGKSGARTRLLQLNGRDRRKVQGRANGGLDAHSHLGDEHGRCPWRCLCVTTAPNVRASADIILLGRLYLGRSWSG